MNSTVQSLNPAPEFPRSASPSSDSVSSTSQRSMTQSSVNPQSLQPIGLAPPVSTNIKYAMASSPRVSPLQTTVLDSSETRSVASNARVPYSNSTYSSPHNIPTMRQRSGTRGTGESEKENGDGDVPVYVHSVLQDPSELDEEAHRRSMTYPSQVYPLPTFTSGQHDPRLVLAAAQSSVRSATNAAVMQVSPPIAGPSTEPIAGKKRKRKDVAASDATSPTVPPKMRLANTSPKIKKSTSEATGSTSPQPIDPREALDAVHDAGWVVQPSADDAFRLSPGQDPSQWPDGSTDGIDEDDALLFNGIRLRPIMQVEKQTVTTTATQTASAMRRRAEAQFHCPVPGCGSTFTRKFNLRGHLRSHTEDRPYVCTWQGCEKGFARKHDCNRHMTLHSTMVIQHACEGCGKSFSRTDALNRHLRSEGGAACKRAINSQVRSSQQLGQAQLEMNQHNENGTDRFGPMYSADEGMQMMDGMGQPPIDVMGSTSEHLSPEPM